MDLKTLCEKVCGIAVEKGDFILKESQNFRINDIQVKGKHDFVSYVDLEAEKKLVADLAVLLPESGFLTEEKTALESETDLKWIIDPLDGTTNFIHGVPVYSISIALSNKGKIILGVILDIKGKELFYAYEKGGAWLNGERIYVTETDRLEDSLIATGFPYRYYNKLDSYMDCLKFFIKNTHGVRRMGSAAIDLAYVACGRFDGFFEYGLNSWDVSAGTIIIREAGGIVSDFYGKHENINGSEIVASNNKLFNIFRDEVQKHMIPDLK